MICEQRESGGRKGSGKFLLRSNETDIKTIRTCHLFGGVFKLFYWFFWLSGSFL